MENMHYAEELVKEFLVFRGFTSTLQGFEKELGTDIGKGFQVDKILDLIFSVYIPKFQAENLFTLLSFFRQCFSSTETVLVATLSKLEVSILKYYIVYALQSGRKDKIIEFFGMNGNDLLQRNQEWTSWFAIPYLKNPSLDPQYRLYFSKEWFDALHLSVRNFLSEMFNGSRIPALLKITSEKTTVNRLKRDIKHLNLKLSRLQALLEEKEAQLCQSRSYASTAADVSMNGTNGATSSVFGNLSSGVHDETTAPSRPADESQVSVNEYVACERESIQDSYVTGPADAHGTSSKLSSHGYGGRGDVLRTFLEGSFSESGGELHQEEDFPEVKVDFQETFLGHTSSISRCRFSASGDNIASASVDGTVRYHSYIFKCLNEGYGRMTHQPQHQEMRQSTVGQRSCR